MKLAGPHEDGDGRPRTAHEARRLALILLTAMLATLPLLLRGNSCGHDFDFHLQSWLAVSQQWRSGVFYPHWVGGANFGAGEPRLVFYPPASWMLGALLGTLLPWSAAGGAFVVVALAGSGLTLYVAAREWSSPNAAALAACMYIANPYAMFVVYERSAYGELLAGIWLPLILLFALRKRASSTSECVVPLALSIAAVWLTNAPAAVMACYMAAIIACIAAVTERQWWPVLRTASGAALGIALAAFYIVPAAYERRWVDIGRAIAPGMRPEDSFLFGHSGEAFHDQVLRSASFIAVAMLAATAAAIFAMWRDRRAASGGESALPARVRQALFALPVAILVLLLPDSGLLWRHAPELRFLQFPWRWLLVLSVVFALLCGMALNGWLNRPGLASKRHRVIAAVGTLAIVAALIGAGQRLFRQPCDEEDIVSAQVAVFHGGGFEGTDEYTTPDTDNGAIQRGLPPVRVLTDADGDEADSSVEQNPAWSQNADDGRNADSSAVPAAKIDVQSWDPESKMFRVETSGAGYAVLRLMDYPAWEVRVNGSPAEARPHRMDGLMAVPVRAGVSTISVHYAVTRDVRWGRAITIAALIVVLLLALRQRRARNRH